MKVFQTKDDKHLYRLDGADKKFLYKQEAIKDISFDNTETTPVMDAKGDLAAYIDSIYACTLDDDGNETRILATPSDPIINSQYTDGSEGQCMVKFPRLWYKYDLDIDGNIQGMFIAGYAKAGYTLHPSFSWGDGRKYLYIGMYEGSGATKLQSISGIVPVTNITIATSRSRAIARKDGATQNDSNWHIMGFWQQHLIDMLFYAYFETRDSQGALPGYTEESGWDTAKIRNTGRSNILTTMNGSVDAQLEAGEDDEDLTNLSAGDKIANRFLFIENIFGHIWKFNDGTCYVPEFDFDAITETLEDNGNMWNAGWGKDLQAVYHTPDIRLFSSDPTDIRDNYEKLNVVPISVAATASIAKAGRGFVPTIEGGTDTQNWCARFYSYLSTTDRPYLRVVRAGGNLNIGASAGVACRCAAVDLSVSAANIGARLCYSKI